MSDTDHPVWNSYDSAADTEEHQAMLDALPSVEEWQEGRIR